MKVFVAQNARCTGTARGLTTAHPAATRKGAPVTEVVDFSIYGTEKGLTIMRVHKNFSRRESSVKGVTAYQAEGPDFTR